MTQPIEFGDSYVDLVARNYDIGGFPFIVFFQMDKSGHGLKRVQIERPRSGAVPTVYRAVLSALIEVLPAAMTTPLPNRRWFTGCWQRILVSIQVA